MLLPCRMTPDWVCIPHCYNLGLTLAGHSLGLLCSPVFDVLRIFMLVCLARWLDHAVCNMLLTAPKAGTQTATTS